MVRKRKNQKSARQKKKKSRDRLESRWLGQVLNSREVNAKVMFCSSLFLVLKEGRAKAACCVKETCMNCRCGKTPLGERVSWEAAQDGRKERLVEFEGPNRRQVADTPAGGRSRFIRCYGLLHAGGNSR